jgi:hypothetical protein
LSIIYDFRKERIMHKLFRISLVLFLLGVSAWATWRIASPAMAQAKAARTAALSAAQSETWNLGVTVEGAPTYRAVIGRLMSDVGAFRSARTVQAATIFPAPASARTVQAASFYLLSRTGAYSGTATLSLKIFDYAGTLQHIASATSIDLQTAPTGVWTPIALSGTPGDLIISPGEFLAFCFTLSDVAAGDLDVRPVFEVSVN